LLFAIFYPQSSILAVLRTPSNWVGPAIVLATPRPQRKMTSMRKHVCGCLVMMACVAGACGAEVLWKAGVARAQITPTNALWLAGYAGRTHAAQGKASELWLKALALEDAEGHRAVVITADLLAIRAPLYRKCLPQLKEKFGLEPAQVLLTASHTHCGPMLPNQPQSLSALGSGERSAVEQYADTVAQQVVEVTGRARADIRPARLVGAQGKAGFGANRRNDAEPQRRQLVQRGALAGPVEHSVPVLAVYEPEGRLAAVLFGYACHNTTLTRDFYQYCADYAGFAQTELERSHPGATALFFIGCAGDQDPVFRGDLGLAQRYGNMLASAVEESLLSPPVPLAPELRTSMKTISLNLGPVPTEAELLKLKDEPASYVRRWAASLLADIKAGKPTERTYPYPVQVWRLGQQLLVTLGGEPVIDYALKFKREFGPQTWVAGYANEVMAYIPSFRVLNEDKPPVASKSWGYEGSQAMMVLGLPALRWGDDVEDLISVSVHQLVQDSGK
jgi:neutral ceramidase